MMNCELGTIYRGPRINLIKGFKRFSICSCIAAVIGAPVVIFKFSAKNSQPDSYGKQVALSIASIVANVGTTFVCHCLLRRYVCSIKVSSKYASDGMLFIEKLSLLLTHIPDKFTEQI